MKPVALGPSWQRGGDGGWLLPEYTLGWDVLAWCEQWLLQPDGPNAGQPWEFTDEQARIVLWWYAVNEAGRFIYRDGVLQRLKGWGKDPFAAALCMVEFVGPCRFSHWAADGTPVGKGHPAAWIQVAAVSRDQTRNTMTLFPGLISKKLIKAWSIDIGKEIIYAEHGARRIEAVTSSPRALEGGRSTFVVRNETHHWLQNNEGLEMAAVINRNQVKSRDGSARALSITNAWEPGEDSVAEQQRAGYELRVAGKANAGARAVMYDSLEAPPGIDLEDEQLLRAVLKLVRGDATWLDIDGIVGDIYDPLTPASRARRFYLNTAIGSESKWVQAPVVDDRVLDGLEVPAGTWITLGFDGSISQDSTVLVGCTEEGHQFCLGMWERPSNPLLAEGWRVPADEVDDAVDAAFGKFNVRRFYCDPQYWQSNIGAWVVDHGDEVVLEWWTNNRDTAMHRALEQEHTALITGQVTLDPVLAPHFKNAHVFHKGSGENELTLIRKERRGSPNKIDGAMAATLAYEARNDAIAAGLFVRPKKRTKVYGF